MFGEELGGSYNNNAGQWQLTDNNDHTDAGHIAGSGTHNEWHIKWQHKWSNSESGKWQHAVSCGRRCCRQGNQLYVSHWRSSLHHWRAGAATGAAAARCRPGASAAEHGQSNVQRIAVAEQQQQLWYGNGACSSSGCCNGHSSWRSIADADANADAVGWARWICGCGAATTAAAAAAATADGQSGQPARGAAAAGAFEQHARAAGQR